MSFPPSLFSLFFVSAWRKVSVEFWWPRISELRGKARLVLTIAVRLQTHASPSLRSVGERPAHTCSLLGLCVVNSPHAQLNPHPYRVSYISPSLPPPPPLLRSQASLLPLSPLLTQSEPQGFPCGTANMRGSFVLPQGLCTCHSL